MNFGDVLFNLKAGMRMARAGWNGSGMWITLVSAGPAITQAFIAMKAADGTVVPWTASQTDLLAEDWSPV